MAGYTYIELCSNNVAIENEVVRYVTRKTEMGFRDTIIAFGQLLELCSKLCKGPALYGWPHNVCSAVALETRPECHAPCPKFEEEIATDKTSWDILVADMTIEETQYSELMLYCGLKTIVKSFFRARMAARREAGMRIIRTKSTDLSES